MKKSTSFGLAMGLVVMVFAGWQMHILGAAEKPMPAPTRVVVVDTEKVFKEYQRRKEIDDRLTRQQQDLQAQRKQKVDRIEALKAELENFHPDSKDYYQRQKELLKLSIDLDSFTKMSAEDIKREFRVQTEDIYMEILKVVDQVARENGYDLVLYKDSTDIRGDTIQELLEKIRGCKVLYSTKQIDITDPVLDALNQAYKLKKSKK